MPAIGELYATASTSGLENPTFNLELPSPWTRGASRSRTLHFHCVLVSLIVLT